MAARKNDFPAIGFVGFGEAAHAIAGHWTRPPSDVFAYDMKLRQGIDIDQLQHRGKEANVVLCTDPADAVGTAGLVFSLVTADQALQAARDCAPFISADCLWLDGNSCSPHTKIEAAAVIEAAGGRYVDVAIMAPVYPKRHEVPVLLSGPHAEAAMKFLVRLGMCPEIAGARVGDASSIKMLRSVMIKGFEALTTECLLAARRAGVEDAVLASLQASDPGIDWRRRATYNLERMMVHGARRAAEMEEVCATLSAFGLPDAISRATVGWQRRLAALHLDPGPDDLALRADRVLDSL
ncbi:NAD(P)-dependent oxidoreductase [Ciceribacter sp. L1K22]|uniref:NAD(P)-dependent oxidoreductase n=1 Tax=Ciceribacter sp. L1K22 TaxID=2820275 RepID=UPI001ABEBCBF|nr:NAD(P)-dependent oxidoreductase [Ciceribacter sp. L1K22]MBO3761578.1 NAD(P)-dependent oxidoreductase [Ciceribacter sp. L1K22]